MRPHANAKGWLANHLAYRDIKCKASATSLILGPCSVRPTRRKGTGTEAYPRGKPRQATPPAYEATHRAGRSAPSTSFFEARSWRLPNNARHDRWLVFRTASKSGGGLTRRAGIEPAAASVLSKYAPLLHAPRVPGPEAGDCLVTQAHRALGTNTHSHSDKLIACCE